MQNHSVSIVRNRNAARREPGTTQNGRHRSTFFNAQSAPIAAHGGHIDKFIGDGLIAFWVLSEGEDAGAKCLEALRAAEEAAKAVSPTHIGNDPLHLRIGLHIGFVLSGDLGSTTRHQFTLIGPEVNNSARLEQLRGTDVVEGSPNIGPIRMSEEFRNELSQPIKKRYCRRSKANAKKIGLPNLDFINEIDPLRTLGEKEVLHRTRMRVRCVAQVFRS